MTKLRQDAKTTSGARRAAGAGSPGPAQEVPRRQAVVVLAMHRSGSSALARVLNLVGCDMPRTLMGGNASNESGHWESTVVRALNDDILDSAGSEWQDWQTFNPDWYGSARVQEFKARAREVLTEEFEGSSLLVLKDPRICRFFPFWDEVLDEAGYDRKVILPFRHPLEVAASLNVRNGMAEIHGLLLWLSHTLEAEHASRGVPRSVISYDQLLDAPDRAMESVATRLGLRWPRLSRPVRREITDFVTERQRHHKAEPAALKRFYALREWLSEVHQILSRWAVSGEAGETGEADRARLDHIRTEFDLTQGFLGEVVKTLTRQAESLREMDKEIGHLRAEAGKRGDAVKALQAERDAARQKDEQIRIELEARAERIAVLDAERERQVEELSKLAQITEAEREEKRELETALADAQAALHQSKSHLEQRRHEAEQEAQALAAAKADLAARDTTIAELNTKTEHQAGELLQQGRALAAARSRISALERDMDDRYRELAVLGSRLIEKEEREKRVRKEVAAMTRRQADETERFDRERGTQQEEMARLREEVVREQDEKAMQDRLIRDLEARNQALLGSTSWKVTWPLRQISLLLRRRA